MEKKHPKNNNNKQTKNHHQQQTNKHTNNPVVARLWDQISDRPRIKRAFTPPGGYKWD